MESQEKNNQNIFKAKEKVHIDEKTKLREELDTVNL